MPADVDKITGEPLGPELLVGALDTCYTELMKRATLAKEELAFHMLAGGMTPDKGWVICEEVVREGMMLHYRCWPKQGAKVPFKFENLEQTKGGPNQ